LGIEVSRTQAGVARLSRGTMSVFEVTRTTKRRLESALNRKGLDMSYPQRIDALEAGIHFMPWILSDHSLTARKPERFFASLGMNWNEVVRECTPSDKAITAFIESFERRLPPDGAYVFPWFELGRRTVFIAEMAGSGAPPELHQQAIASYHALLERTAIGDSEREQLAALVCDMADGPIEEEEAKLDQIFDRLRSYAAALSPARPEPVLWQTPWTRWVLYLFGAAIIGSLVLGATGVMPLLALPVVIAAAIFGVGVAGVIQLQDDEDMRDEPLFEKMAFSFRRIPFVERGMGGGNAR
jgi:hypothetical protein